MQPPSRGVLLLVAGTLAVAGTQLQAQQSTTGASGTCSNDATAFGGLPGVHLNALQCAALALLLWALIPRKPRVFVVDFAVFHPPAR